MIKRGGQRAHAIAATLFCAGAVVGWWLVVDEGPSTARVLAAVATSVAGVAEVIRVVRTTRRAKEERSELPAENAPEQPSGLLGGSQERDGS
jgi:hypothetical protein